MAKRIKKEVAVVEKPKTLKIKFLLSPTGKFNLGYNIGDVAEFETKTAQELVDACYAEIVK